MQKCANPDIKNLDMEEIILASSSPRREAILKTLKLPFRVIVPDCDESGIITRDPVKKVKEIALLKGTEVLSRLEKQDRRPDFIAGFDTLIEINGKTIGKAGSREDASDMLSLLSGRTHFVHTGVALYPGRQGKWDVRAEKSIISFNRMSEKEIDWYISTGEWEGAAGSYRIQEKGAFFIKSIKGSYSNIVGLPISLFYVMLRDNNYSFSLRMGS